MISADLRIWHPATEKMMKPDGVLVPVLRYEPEAYADGYMDAINIADWEKPNDAEQERTPMDMMDMTGPFALRFRRNLKRTI